nr:HupE/UreJ family protein [Gammaproteobacteria bacterium]
MKFAVRFSWLLVGLLGPVMAVAHDARPNYVQITETVDNTFSVNWKVP